MNRDRQTSPFAAKTRQEQLEQWICWQQEQRARKTGGTLAEELPVREEPEQPQEPETAVQPNLPPMRIGHRQYDAVMNKMRHARQLAGSDQQWSG